MNCIRSTVFVDRCTRVRIKISKENNNLGNRSIFFSLASFYCSFFVPQVIIFLISKKRFHKKAGVYFCKRLTIISSSWQDQCEFQAETFLFLRKSLVFKPLEYSKTVTHYSSQYYASSICYSITQKSNLG